MRLSAGNADGKFLANVRRIAPDAAFGRDVLTGFWAIL
jgi:hypothetical protein